MDTEKTLFPRLRRRFQKGLADYRLIDDGDRILIALSGGKDSLALAELLAARARVWHPRFEVEAAHVVMANIGYRTDTAFLHDFCSRLGIALHVVEATFDATGDTRKSPCFLCSWNRRKALFALAQERGCNKIALGHHMDDILQTLLMNLAYQGAFSTMPPLLRMRKFGPPAPVARPAQGVSLRARLRAHGHRRHPPPAGGAEPRGSLQPVGRDGQCAGGTAAAPGRRCFAVKAWAMFCCARALTAQKQALCFGMADASSVSVYQLYQISVIKNGKPN